MSRVWIGEFNCYLSSQGIVLHLVVQQRLQSTLRNLWLVGRVLRSPSWVLEDIPQDRVRDVAVVVAHSDIRSPDLVLVRNAANPVDQRVLI